MLSLCKNGLCPQEEGRRTYAYGFVLTPLHLLTQFTWYIVSHEQEGSVRLVVKSVAVEGSGLQHLGPEATPKTMASCAALARVRVCQRQAPAAQTQPLAAWPLAQTQPLAPPPDGLPLS